MECGADAVLALKGNQRTQHDEMLLLFEKELAASPHLFAKYQTPAEKNSGRIERRTRWQTGYVRWFEDIDKWEGLRSVIMVEAERTARNAETGEWATTSERRLFISSLKVDPKRAHEAVRRHWGVESMHWTLDVTYGEDYCRAQTRARGGQPRHRAADGALAGKPMGQKAQVRDQGGEDVCGTVKESGARDVVNVNLRRSPVPGASPLFTHAY